MSPTGQILIRSSVARLLLPSNNSVITANLLSTTTSTTTSDVWTIGEDDRGGGPGSGRRSSRRVGFAGFQADNVGESAGAAAATGGFRSLVIPGLTKEPEKPAQLRSRHPLIPRCSNMHPANSSWCSVWPRARSFHPAVVPLPVRQGRPNNATENAGISPNKWGNTELMKVPNFLHLTPAHVTAHCQAIRHLCTPWPEALNNPEVVDKHLPIRVVTTDYMRAGHSIRDERARRVEISLRLDRLVKLADRSLDKLLCLVSFSNFARVDTDPDTRVKRLHLWSDRCPWRFQNYDYLMYVLSALYSQSLRCEVWEAKKQYEDNRLYEFQGSSSQHKLDLLPRKPSPNAVQNYKNALLSLHRPPTEGGAGETHESLRQYGQAVEKLLGIGGGGGSGSGQGGKKPPRPARELPKTNQSAAAQGSAPLASN